MPIDWQHELYAALLITLGMGALFLISELWSRRFKSPVEWTRKFVHISAGITVSLFPWIFASPLTVITMGVFFISVLMTAKRRGYLRSVFGVERKSYGVLLYLFSVAFLFTVLQGYEVYYFVSMLTLTVSDALAALLGRRYAMVSYDVEDHKKSLEGSAVFLLCTYLVVHTPLLLMTNLDPAVATLIAMQAAISVTFVEAISFDGIDNLSIPVVTAGCITLMATHDAVFLGSQMLVQVAALVVMGVLKWRYPVFKFAGAMTLQLFCFAAYCLGGKAWITAPIMGLSLFALFCTIGRVARSKNRSLSVVPVFYCFLTGCLIFVTKAFGRRVEGLTDFFVHGDPMFTLYVGAFAAQAAIAWGWALRAGKHGPWVQKHYDLLSLLLALLALVTVIVPSHVLHPHGLHLFDVVIGSAILVAAIVIRRIYIKHPPIAAHPFFEYRIQALSVLSAVTLFAPLFLIWRTV